jgi:hypothetical protein
MRPPCLWDKGHPPPSDLTGKVYGGMHTLPAFGFELVTPFTALYGYHPPSITSSLKKKSKVQAVEDHIENQ